MDKSLYKKEPYLFVLSFLILSNLANIGIYWCFLLIPYFLYKMPYICKKIDNNSVVIGCFSILYVSFLLVNVGSVGYSYSLIIGFLFLPFLCYLLGRYLTSKYSYNDIGNILYFIVFSMTIFLFLANLRAALESGLGAVTRNIKLFFLSQPTAATAINGYLSLSIVIAPMSFLRRKRILSILLGFMGIYSAFNMSSRTGLLLALLSLLVFCWVSRKNGKILVWAYSILFLFSLAFVFDVGGIQTFYDESLIGKRFEEDLFEGGGRTELWYVVPLYLSENYFGGTPPYPLIGEYAHNILLDVALRGGILSFILLLYLLCRSVADTYGMMNNKIAPFDLRVILLLLMCAFGTVMMLEPVMEGLYILYFLFFFVWGTICEMKHKSVQLK